MPSKQQSKRALDIYEETLGQYKNVVGMGLVQLDAEDQASRGSKEAVAVYVSQKLPEAELAPEEIIPRYLEIKGRGKTVRVPTKVIEQGEVTLDLPGKEPL